MRTSLDLFQAFLVLHVVGIEFQRRLELSNTFWNSPHSRKCGPKPVVDLRGIGVSPLQNGELIDGLGGTARLQENKSQVEAGMIQLRSRFQAGLKGVDRARKISRRIKGNAKRHLRIIEIGIDPDGFLQLFGGFCCFTFFREFIGQHVANQPRIGVIDQIVTPQLFVIAEELRVGTGLKTKQQKRQDEQDGREGARRFGKLVAGMFNPRDDQANEPNDGDI